MGLCSLQQSFPQRSTPWFWTGMDGGQVGSSLLPLPKSRLIIFERSLHHSYMLDMSMRLVCFSYPSWLATSRNSSVIRIKPRSKLNSAGNFTIQYLKDIKYFWQPEDFKLDLCGNYGVILQITFNNVSRPYLKLAISYPPSIMLSCSSLLQSRTQVHHSYFESLFLSRTTAEKKPFSQLMASRWECVQ